MPRDKRSSLHQRTSLNGGSWREGPGDNVGWHWWTQGRQVNSLPRGPQASTPPRVSKFPVIDHCSTTMRATDWCQCQRFSVCCCLVVPVTECRPPSAGGVQADRCLISRRPRHGAWRGRLDVAYVLRCCCVGATQAMALSWRCRASASGPDADNRRKRACSNARSGGW